MPGHFVEHVYHLEKYACGKCRGGVTTAKGPTPVLERSSADASLLAHVVVSKHVDHVPLHRLHRIYARSGARIAVSTMSDWVRGVAQLVEPLVEQLEKRILKSELVRTDATGIKVLDPDSPENIERGTNRSTTLARLIARTTCGQLGSPPGGVGSLCANIAETLRPLKLV